MAVLPPDPYKSFDNHPNFIWLASIAIIVPSIVALGSISKIFNKTTEKIFDYLGWISYPLYCIHVPIYLIFTVVTNNKDYSFFSFISLISITVFLSHLLAKYIEEPIRYKLNFYLK